MPGSASRSGRRSARRSTSSPRRRSSPLILTGPERLATTTRRSLSILRPPPELTISAWADANRRLSSEASAEPGQWRTSRAEYQRGIMDAISDGAVESVVIMSSSQVGKSEALGNAVGYYIDQDPAPSSVTTTPASLVETGPESLATSRAAGTSTSDVAAAAMKSGAPPTAPT